MFSVKRYCVKAFSLDGGCLRPVEPQQYRERHEALRAATVMLKRLPLVEVYEVTGWPVHDIWDRPLLIERLERRSSIPAPSIS